MKTDAVSIAAGLLLILVITAAGCIEIPKIGGADLSKPTTSKTPGGIYNPLNPTATPTPPMYVTVVTPFETVKIPVPAVTTQGYSVFPVPSPVPEDLTCLIYTKSQAYAYNASAFSFNLQNPPMYINYSVTPQNITVKKVGDSRQLSNNDVTLTYSTYSPNSWFLVTVRNKTTGEIYLKDGFGKDYRQYITATITVPNRDDLLVEFSGNQITATASIWVKPLGNFENLQNLTFPACKYWGAPRNVIDYPTATPTPTWTP